MGILTCYQGLTTATVDAGKSTMLGVLVKGGLDDGRGKARVNLFRHKHEIESGRTSSVGMEIMGFDSKGEIVSATVPGRKLSWEEIGNRSAKVISFTDLAGHERYLRTTVFGMLSSEPNYCLLMVAANNGLIGMSKCVYLTTTLSSLLLTMSQRALGHCFGLECPCHGRHHQNRHLPSADSSADNNADHQDSKVPWRSENTNLHQEPRGVCQHCSK